MEENEYKYLDVILDNRINSFIYLFIHLSIYLFYFQSIYRWQILLQFTTKLAFLKRQHLSHIFGAVCNIAECWYR